MKFFGISHDKKCRFPVFNNGERPSKKSRIMKSEKLFTELLNRKLTPVSIEKLYKLYQMLKSENEYTEYAVLAEAFRKDKIIQSVFRFSLAHPMRKPPDLFTGYLVSGEIMTILDISERTLAHWRKSGILPYHVFRTKCYYSVKDVENLLLKNYSGVSKLKEL